MTIFHMLLVLLSLGLRNEPISNQDYDWNCRQIPVIRLSNTTYISIIDQGYDPEEVSMSFLNLFPYHINYVGSDGLNHAQWWQATTDDESGCDSINLFQ